MGWKMFWKMVFLSHRLHRWLYENMIMHKLEVLGFSNSAFTNHILLYIVTLYWNILLTNDLEFCSSTFWRVGCLLKITSFIPPHSKVYTVPEYQPTMSMWYHPDVIAILSWFHFGEIWTRCFNFISNLHIQIYSRFHG